MIKAIIVEDEKKSRETLSGLLKLYCKDLQVVAEADGVYSGIEIICEYKPDVVFLDIQMPDGSGFKLLERTRDLEFEVIFTTAYDQFAIKAIKYSALDYLLKPIFPDDLLSAVEKLRKKLGSKRTKEGIDALLHNLKKPESDPPRIVLSTAEKLHVVATDDILRCESDNYYTVFYFTNGKKLMVSKTLKENEELLSEHNFVRPHKSHLVNLKYVRGMSKTDGASILMSDGSEVPVSRRKRDKITEILSSL
ncbi:MAG: response regulator transcription factor [Bacteroidales bacterium]|nr:response regulator transcription factor [Bacteroidales bacterium]